MNLQRVEIELKKRLLYPYHWDRKQSDTWDRETRYIYTTYSANMVIVKGSHLPKQMVDYALNRWYNFWSAKAVEEIFALSSIVKPNLNIYDKLVDFEIDGIPFDHKSTIFPRGFGKSYKYARENEDELIEWLYQNQSSEGRRHLKNRLFIVLYDARNQEHWKMKSQIGILREAIDSYLDGFESSRLHRFDFGEGEVLSDIIWIG